MSEPRDKAIELVNYFLYLPLSLEQAKNCALKVCNENTMLSANEFIMSKQLHAFWNKVYEWIEIYAKELKEKNVEEIKQIARDNYEL